MGVSSWNTEPGEKLKQKCTMLYLVLFTVSKSKPSRLLQTIKDLYYIKCYVKMFDEMFYLHMSTR